MSNEFNYSEETVHLAGYSAVGPVYAYTKTCGITGPETTMLSEDALEMFSEDGITVNSLGI